MQNFRLVRVRLQIVEMNLADFYDSTDVLSKLDFDYRYQILNTSDLSTQTRNEEK